MHSPEEGHKCPKCGRRMICTIEDGYCAVGGAESNLCGACLSQSYFDAIRSNDDYDDR
jgi:hypothetical protein